jgi:ribonuclease G
MFRKIIVNENVNETRVALLENSSIVELFIERKGATDITGNIYKGRVQRVLPGMQAAFVDLGLRQAAFIYVDDVLQPSPEQQIPDSSLLEEDSLREQKVPIGSLIKEGQNILVRVAKAPLGTKGARITAYITLPGRFLVLMPFSDHIGVSRRIEDEEERKRLKDIVEKGRDSVFGYIVRTAAEGTNEEKILSEMQFLRNMWQNIQNKYEQLTAPALLHKELNVSLRTVRDLVVHEADSIVVDSKNIFNEVMGFLDKTTPHLKESVELYKGSEPVFDAYHIEGEISRALKRKVWLKTGGYIVIEQTEALVSIDVNTGRYVGKYNLEETILKTNLEAAKEIAYQIRLRDLGGIIIIDFIDMSKKSNQERVYKTLLEELQKDRSKTQIFPMTEIGLIQMTRKRVREPLSQILCESCFYCEGEAILKSKKTICMSIYRDVIRESKEMQGGRLTLITNSEIAELLHGEERHLISDLEQKIKKQIIIYPNEKFHLEQYDFYEERRMEG